MDMILKSSRTYKVDSTHISKDVEAEGASHGSHMYWRYNIAEYDHIKGYFTKCDS